MAASRLRSVTMSRTWGMFSRITVSSVRRAAAIAGRAAFLAPLTRIVPTSGLPPRTTSLSIERSPEFTAWETASSNGALFQRRANYAECLPQAFLRLRPGQASLGHHNGHLNAAAGSVQRFHARFVAESRGLHHDANAALRQLTVLEMDIDHQVFIDEADAGHRSGGQHVYDHLLRRAGFHARRTGQHFRTGFDDDSNLGCALQRRAAIAGDCDCLRAFRTGELQGGDGVRRASAGRNANHNIAATGFVTRQVVASVGTGVFVSLNGSSQCLFASSHNEPDAVGSKVECRRTLHRIQSTNPSAGARADVNQLATA